MVKLGKEKRGAALMEYGLVLGLIAGAALWGVSQVGDNIVELLNTTTDEIKFSENPDTTEDPPGPQHTFTWKGDGNDILPSYVTVSGSYWIVDIASFISEIADPNDVDQISKLRANVEVSMAASFQPKAQGLSGVSMTIDPRVRWIRPSTTATLTNKIVTGSYPESEILAYNEALAMDVPDDATGIRIQRYNSCTPNTICTLGEFYLDVEFYLAP